MSRDNKQTQRPPGEPPHPEARGEDHDAERERQVHQRNQADKTPGEAGYVNVPPGEQGQYGLRRSGTASPWYDDPNTGSHSADEHDSHYAQWRREQIDRFDAEYRDWKKERYGNFCKDFETWRRAQTAPGTNVGARPSDQAKDK